MASIRERTTKADEKTWAVLYRVENRQSSMTFATSKAAERFKALIDLLGPARAMAELDAEASSGPTLDDLAAAFFDWKARDVTPRTIRDYRRDYANRVSPALGSRRAESIDERDVQQFIDQISAELDPKTVADRHMLLYSIFKWASAKSRGLVSHNPCLETDLPKRRKRPPKGVTLPEWYALHAAALEVEPDAADLMEFIVASGWRWSEAAAITVDRVEEFPDREGVERMFVRMGQVMRQGQVVQDAAKSDAGFRRIKVPSSTAAMIRRRLVGRGPGDLVFTNAAGQKWYQQNFLNRTWTRIVRASGLSWRPTPHMLRHTHVALLDRAGVSLPEMQRRLGHESIETTINVYGGMIDDMSGEALDALDELLTGARTPVAGEVVSGAVVPRLGDS